MLKKTLVAVVFAVFTLCPLISGIAFHITKSGDYSSPGTFVGGYISENTTWTLEGSPYIVIENVIVEPDVTLSIEPGVIVKFANGTELIIDGALIAQGNATHKIIFTSNSTTPQPGDWGGIRFRDRSDDTRCIIEWAIIQYANFGVFSELASPKIQNSIVRWNRYAGIDGFKSGLSVINSTILENIGTGISGHGDQTGVIWEILNSNISLNGGYGVDIYLYMYSSATINNNLILNNNLTGISIYVAPSMHSCSATISKNRVLNNGKNGLLFGAKPYPSEGGIYANIGLSSSLSILNNTVSGNNGAGVFVDMDYSTGSNVNLSKNIVSNNNGTGLHLEWKYHPPSRFVASELIVTFNNQSGLVSNIGPVWRSNIFSNSPYNFVVTSSDDVDATFNWWGTANETVIKEYIYDYYDDYNLGRVLYKPFLVPPTANFTFLPETPYACETVTFDASLSFNPYGSIINYNWDFGDGNVTTTTSPIITHKYAAAGNYNITLEVADEFGLVNCTIKSLTVLQDDVPPATVDDYDNLWHDADFTITLTATDNESGVAETYYRINNGPVKRVSVDGYPLITSESSNNTLEYWSIDNAGNEEVPHKFLFGIKLDKTAPSIIELKRQPESDVEPNQPVKVFANVTDFLSGVKDVILIYCIGNGSSWINVLMSFNATSGLYEGVIQGQQAGVTVKYKISVYDNAGNSMVEDNEGQYYVYTVIPEFPSSMVFLTLTVLLSIFAILLKKRGNNPKG